MKQAILYQIININNGKKYIGVTNRTIRVRWNEHLCKLRKGISSAKIQLDFNIHG